MLLRHEKRTILEAAAENVLAFDEAIYDLRRERMLTAAHLKAAELKLLVLRQARLIKSGTNVFSCRLGVYHLSWPFRLPVGVAGKGCTGKALP